MLAALACPISGAIKRCSNHACNSSSSSSSCRQHHSHQHDHHHQLLPERPANSAAAATECCRAASCCKVTCHTAVANSKQCCQGDSSTVALHPPQKGQCCCRRSCAIWAVLQQLSWDMMLQQPAACKPLLLGLGLGPGGSITIRAVQLGSAAVCWSSKQAVSCQQYTCSSSGSSGSCFCISISSSSKGCSTHAVRIYLWCCEGCVLSP